LQETFGLDLYREHELKEMNGFYFTNTQLKTMFVQIKTHKPKRNLMMKKMAVMKMTNLQRREDKKLNMQED